MPVKITPTIPFTAAAYAQNQAEFERLTQQRVEVMERLKAAREMGDLSENGAYKYAKFELGDIGRRLRYLKHVLTHGYVAEAATSTQTVAFGRTVVLESDGVEYTFLLVSEHESDFAQQKLATSSPLGKAIMGKTVGEQVQVDTPRGPSNYKIMRIS